MDEDDLPPPPRRPSESFAGEMGATIGRAVWILALMAIIGAVVYLAIKVWGR
jgi:hypothetical protein